MKRAALGSPFSFIPIRPLSKDELKRWHLESLKQVQRFRESSGCPVEDLTYGQALLTEAKFAQWLKNEGYPAYFA